MPNGRKVIMEKRTVALWLGDLAAIGLWLVVLGLFYGALVLTGAYVIALVLHSGFGLDVSASTPLVASALATVVVLAKLSR